MMSAPSWEVLQAIGGVLGSIGAGAWGALQLKKRQHRSHEHNADAEVGRESATTLVHRAEARMKEMHDLRDNLNTTLGQFSMRLLSVEKDVQRIEGNLDTCTTNLVKQYEELRADMKEGKNKLDAILTRVYAIPGGRRRHSDDETGQ